MNGMPLRPGARVALRIGLALWAGAVASAQTDRGLPGRLPPGPPLRPETTLSALIGVEVDREIEATALANDLTRLAHWRSRRDDVLTSLRDLYQSLDTTFNTDEEGEKPPASVEDLERRILEQEALLGALGAEGRELRERLRSRRDRIAALGEKSQELVAMLPADVDSVTGVWDVRLSPTSETGVITLYQSGTLLTGEYVLAGGWHGSLEGTLVDGRVFLDRIDARKGRFASLTGLLDSQGKTIRGTWKERDLTAGRPTDGAWIARKRATSRPETP
jgi:hypothetical protein